MPNPPDLIPRSAVLEAIDMRCDADTLVALREYIAALPAAPVDSTPEQFARDLAASQVDTPPEVNRLIGEHFWDLIDDSTPALTCAEARQKSLDILHRKAESLAQERRGQPALDVALTADERAAESSLRETANAIVTPRVFTVLAILDKMRTALTTLDARLQQERTDRLDAVEQRSAVEDLWQAALDRADAAEQALADAQATLGRLGEVECIESLDGETWNFRDDDGRFCSWPTLRIRRVLDAGGTGK